MRRSTRFCIAMVAAATAALWLALIEAGNVALPTIATLFAGG